MLKFERYELAADESLTVFEFYSEGPRGRIRKIVQYAQTNVENIYNLGFGDFDKRSNEIDDRIISNNGDSTKVLATVAATVYAFTDRNPKSWIYAAGSSKARTRLYRIGISNNIAEISVDFEVYGLLKGIWKPFEKNANYEAFLIRRK